MFIEIIKAIPTVLFMDAAFAALFLFVLDVLGGFKLQLYRVAPNHATQKEATTDLSLWGKGLKNSICHQSAPQDGEDRYIITDDSGLQVGINHLLYYIGCILICVNSFSLLIEGISLIKLYGFVNLFKVSHMFDACIALEVLFAVFSAIFKHTVQKMRNYMAIKQTFMVGMSNYLLKVSQGADYYDDIQFINSIRDFLDNDELETIVDASISKEDPPTIDGEALLKNFFAAMDKKTEGQASWIHKLTDSGKEAFVRLRDYVNEAETSTPD